MIVNIKRGLKKKMLNQTNTTQSSTHTNVVVENKILEWFLTCLVIS
jgi:hypothetical protein